MDQEILTKAEIKTFLSFKFLSVRDYFLLCKKKLKTNYSNLQKTSLKSDFVGFFEALWKSAKFELIAFINLNLYKF